MKSYKYYVLDVFTGERFRGNPLGVVFTGSDLELSTYENISREFGYSETSFIYYSKKDKALKIRSFTPTGFEVDGAGHNLLGAVCAALLQNMEIFHEQKGKPFVIMKDEVIHLSIDSITNLPFVGMLQQPASVGNSVDPKIIAEALTLNPDDIGFENLVPTVVKTEVAHLMVPLKNLEILNKAAVSNKSLLINTANEYGFEGVYCFTILKNDPQHFAQSRFFSPGIGIDEDPATGSAAGPLAGFLFHQKYIDQDTPHQILQGVKVNHPSVIKFEVKDEGIWISGSSIIVMEGTIYE